MTDKGGEQKVESRNPIDMVSVGGTVSTTPPELVTGKRLTGIKRLYHDHEGVFDSILTIIITLVTLPITRWFSMMVYGFLVFGGMGIARNWPLLLQTIFLYLLIGIPYLVVFGLPSVLVKFLLKKWRYVAISAVIVALYVLTLFLLSIYSTKQFNRIMSSEINKAIETAKSAQIAISSIENLSEFDDSGALGKMKLKVVFSTNVAMSMEAAFKVVVRGGNTESGGGDDIVLPGNFSISVDGAQGFTGFQDVIIHTQRGGTYSITLMVEDFWFARVRIPDKKGKIKVGLSFTIPGSESGYGLGGAGIIEGVVDNTGKTYADTLWNGRRWVDMGEYRLAAANEISFSPYPITIPSPSPSPELFSYSGIYKGRKIEGGVPLLILEEKNGTVKDVIFSDAYAINKAGSQVFLAEYFIEGDGIVVLSESKGGNVIAAKKIQNLSR